MQWINYGAATKLHIKQNVKRKCAGSLKEIPFASLKHDTMLSLKQNEQICTSDDILWQFNLYQKNITQLLSVGVILSSAYKFMNNPAG